jgi:hypothetical protein
VEGCFHGANGLLDSYELWRILLAAERLSAYQGELLLLR